MKGLMVKRVYENRSAVRTLKKNSRKDLEVRQGTKLKIRCFCLFCTIATISDPESMLLFTIILTGTNLNNFTRLPLTLTNFDLYG